MRTKATVVVLMLAAGTAFGQPTVNLSNNIPGDGHLSIGPDTYGAYSVWSWPPNADNYDPGGPSANMQPTFASALFMYSRATSDRVVFAETTATTPNLNSTYNLRAAGGATISYAITSPLVALDMDSDGVNDTALSSFSATGGAGGFDLTFDLTQSVEKPAGGSAVATLRQTYRVVNNAPAPATFTLERHTDCDLPWFGTATTFPEDVAGAIAGAGGQINPYMREPVPDPLTPDVISMTGTTPNDYVSGKSGFDPDGASPDPAMAFGTDFQIWIAFGLPDSWKNYTAGVGHNVPGELPGERPAGSATPWDAFMGLQWDVTLAPGESKVIEIVTTYGARTPDVPPGPQCGCPGDLNNNDAVEIGDLPLFVAALLDSFFDVCADMNSDGSDDGGDIRAFVTAVLDNAGAGRPCAPVESLDAWETPEPGAGTDSSYEFGGPHPPIPADFFGPGSEPFTGTIELAGLPLDIDRFGSTDTVVRRGPLAGLPVETVPIELVELSLVSVNPITVTFPTGSDNWLLTTSLSDTEPPAGTLTAMQDPQNPNTGVFTTSGLMVQPVFVFAREQDLVALEAGQITPDQVQIRVLDTGQAGQPPLQLQFPQSGSFVREVCQEFIEQTGLFVFPQHGAPFVPGLIQPFPPPPPPECVFKPGPMPHVKPGERHYIAPPNRPRGVRRCEYLFSGMTRRLGGCTATCCPKAPARICVRRCNTVLDCPRFVVRIVRCRAAPGCRGWCLQLYWRPRCVVC